MAVNVGELLDDLFDDRGLTYDYAKKISKLVGHFMGGDPDVPEEIIRQSRALTSHLSILESLHHLSWNMDHLTERFRFRHPDHMEDGEEEPGNLLLHYQQFRETLLSNERTLRQLIESNEVNYSQLVAYIRQRVDAEMANAR